jgi:hypothetical protein
MPTITLPAKSQHVNFANWIILLIKIGALVLGLLHMWAAATSYSMNADGINYLDIGDAYWRGDWKDAINPVWSPLYSWVLGGVMRVFQPRIHWEFPLVHAVNFGIYMLAMGSFAYFWKQVGEYRQARLFVEPNRGEITIPDWSFYAFGYLLFTWSSLNLIEIWAVTPDMLMAAIVYLAGALLLRIRMLDQSWTTYVLLGFFLGMGYLAKTIMLPVAFLFLGASIFSANHPRRIIPQVISALLVFILISGPYIILISLSKGRFTYGESGPITYMRYVNQIPYPHWQGEPDGYGFPIHPSRQVLRKPPIFEFGTPIGGTYPISYDPTYWYEGVKLNYSLQQIFPNFISSFLVYFDLFFHKLGPVLACILIMYLVATRRWSGCKSLGNWSLVIISTFVLVLYSLIYVEGRYIAVFVVLLMADLIANLSLPNHQAFRKLITVASLVMILSLLGNLVASNLEGYKRLSSRNSRPTAVQNNAPPPVWPGEVVEELQLLGIHSGDQVAVIGYAFDSFWARLARVKIVAEMLISDADLFWFGNTELQIEVIQAFQSTGARAIIAEEVPDHALLSAWHRVGETNIYIYPFYE